MAIRPRLHFAAAVVFTIALAACSNDDNPAGGGDTDTTLPTVASVTPIDVFHVEVAFNEQVTRSSAEDIDHYRIVVAGTPLPAPATPPTRAQAPGDLMGVAALSLRPDRRTVVITTVGVMAGLDLTLGVVSVADTHGNEIDTWVDRPFMGSDSPDTTAPEIVSRSPVPFATNIPVGQVVRVQFSEPVNFGGFVNGVLWVSEHEVIPNQVQSDDGVRFEITPLHPLANGAVYSITLDLVSDLASNRISETTWTFTTTHVIDATPPTLVSTAPANLATHVNVNTDISLTFSEAVNQFEFNVALTPNPGVGVTTWSNGGKTVTFDLIAPLLDNEQYTLTVSTDGVRDLAGNGFAGLKTVVFTTGYALAAGSIAGTITGDPGSEASDPTGATVIAANGFAVNDGASDIVATTIVATDNTYTISHLPDGFYFPLAIMDTSGDGDLDPSGGDAIGALGVDLALGDQDPDSVVINGGSHAAGVNFPMFDPSAITGTVAYEGTYDYGAAFTLYIGLFDITGFDPSNQPVVGTLSLFPNAVEWGFNTLDQGLADGFYYLGAFMDVNNNGTFEPGIDPAGFYGGLPLPTVLRVSNGDDFAGIVIALADPTTANSSAGVAWPGAKHSATFQRLCDVLSARLQAEACLRLAREMPSDRE